MHLYCTVKHISPLTCVCSCVYQNHVPSRDVHVGVGRLFAPGGGASARRRARHWSVTQLRRYAVYTRGVYGIGLLYRRLHCHSLPTQFLEKDRDGHFMCQYKTYLKPTSVISVSWYLVGSGGIRRRVWAKVSELLFEFVMRAMAQTVNHTGRQQHSNYADDRDHCQNQKL